MISISEIQKQVFKTAVEHGWWPIDIKAHDYIERGVARIDLEKVNIPEKIALMHSELSEALEFYRNSGSDGIDESQIGYVIYKLDNPEKPDGMWVELADCIIRILDLAGAYDIDMEEILEIKAAYNKTRPYRHGNKKC